MSDPTTLIVDTAPTGEEIPFEPEYAETFFWDRDKFHAREISDSGLLVRIDAEDEDGNDLRLTYSLSQILIDTAEYDQPDDDVTATTAPASTDRKVVYGADTYNPDLISLGDARFSLPTGARTLWDQALDIEVREDFICATGTDYADPVGNQYDAYWILTHASYADSPGQPFFVHEKATQEAVLERVLQLDAKLDETHERLSAIEAKLDEALDG